MTVVIVVIFTGISEAILVGIELVVSQEWADILIVEYAIPVVIEIDTVGVTIFIEVGVKFVDLVVAVIVHSIAGLERKIRAGRIGRRAVAGIGITIVVVVIIDAVRKSVLVCVGIVLVDQAIAIVIRSITDFVALMTYVGIVGCAIGSVRIAIVVRVGLNTIEDAVTVIVREILVYELIAIIVQAKVLKE